MLHREVFTFALALPFAYALPASSIAAVGEDIPWKLTNLSVNALPANTTDQSANQHITFTVSDDNVASGLNFTTTCSRVQGVGYSLYSNAYYPCVYKDSGFSLREDGTLWFHRSYLSNVTGVGNSADRITCTGFGDLKEAQYYSNGPEGMTVFAPLLEIPCTLMSSTP